MGLERTDNIHAYAVGLVDRFPEAAAVGVALGPTMGERPCALAVGLVIRDEYGPITGPRMQGAEREGGNLAYMQAVAGIRACRQARERLVDALAAGA